MQPDECRILANAGRYLMLMTRSYRYKWMSPIWPFEVRCTEYMGAHMWWGRNGGAAVTAGRHSGTGPNQMRAVGTSATESQAIGSEGTLSYMCQLAYTPKPSLSLTYLSCSPYRSEFLHGQFCPLSGGPGLSDMSRMPHSRSCK